MKKGDLINNKHKIFNGKRKILEVNNKNREKFRKNLTIKERK